MEEKISIFLWITILILTIWVVRGINTWRFKRTYKSILSYLKEKQAVSPSSAIHIPGSKKSIFNAGMRNFKPEALRFLLSQNKIDKTEDNRYYLKTNHNDNS